MKVFSIESAARIFVHSVPTNMGKSFRGLTEMIASEMKKNPESGDLFLFMNKNKTYLKVLFYSCGGYCIFAKRLNAGVFSLDVTRPGVKIDLPKLQRLLENPIDLAEAA